MGRKALFLIALVLSQAGSAGAESTWPLDFGTPQQRRIAAGETHRYSFTVDAGQYLWFLVIQRGADVRLILRDLDGREETADDRATRGGAENLYWITERAGEHTLEVRSAGDHAGAYELKWMSREPATEDLRLRTPADREYARALGLQQRGERGALEEAIRLLRSTLAVWDRVGDDAQAASALDNVGSCHYQLEDYAAAASFYRQAIGRWPDPQYRVLGANSMHNLAAARVELGQIQSAIGGYQAALKVFEDEGQALRAARTRRALADAYKSAGRLAEAEAAADEALAVFVRLENPDGRLQALNTLGSIYTHAGRVEDAFEALKQAQGLAETDDGLGAGARAAVASNLASVHNWIGEPMLALDEYRKALELNRSAGDRGGEAIVLRQLGLLYRGLGEYEDALHYLRRAAELRTELGKTAGAAELRIIEGDVLRQAGRPAEALEVFEPALSTLDDRGTAVQRMTAWEKQGLALEAAGRTAEAQAAYRRAFTLLDQVEEPAREARLRAASAASELAAGALDDAQRDFDRALDLSLAGRDHATEVEVLVGLSRLETRRGNLESAQERAEAALAVVESVRGRVGGEQFRASYFSQQVRAFELAATVLLARHRREPQAGFDRRAFEVSERMRARVLYDLIVTSRAEIRSGVEPELVSEERALRRWINARETFLGTSGRRLTAEIRRELDRELEEKLRAYRELEGRIFRQSPDFQELAHSRPISLETVQRQLLDDDTALLEILLAEERSLMWAVTSSGYRLVELPARARLEDDARELHELLTRPGRRPSRDRSGERRAWSLEESERRYVELGAELTSRLLQPVEDLIGDRRLLVVADGALRLLPFAALPTPASTVESWQPLLAVREVVEAPSASVLAALRRKHAERAAPDRLLAVFADPVFRPDERVSAGPPPEDDPRMQKFAAVAVRGAGRALELPRLRHTRSEAEAILALAAGRGPVLAAMDFEASRDRALAPDLARYRYVHFATHGIVDDHRPELSGIVLSMVDPRGDRQDGLVRLHDIYEMRLGAELVVLSACETAVGQEVRGEGLLSLTRGFMYAGAPRVMASLWPVDDRSTAELMGRFYRGLLEDQLRPAAAFRRAVIEARSAAGAADRTHPGYWAGFVLFGDWR